MFMLIILRTVHHKALIFHMLIGLGQDRSSDCLKFTRSKVKVAWVNFEIKYVNSFLKLLHEGTYTIPIQEVTLCQ